MWISLLFMWVKMLQLCVSRSNLFVRLHKKYQGSFLLSFRSKALSNNQLIMKWGIPHLKISYKNDILLQHSTVFPRYKSSVFCLLVAWEALRQTYRCRRIKKTTGQIVLSHWIVFQFFPQRSLILIEAWRAKNWSD